MSTQETPRIYVACLAAYNSGRLHGAWIDATDADTMREAIAEMLKTSPEPGAEEYAIHDYDGFCGIQLSEYEDLDTVAALANAIEEHGEAFAAWAANSADNRENPENFSDEFRGEYDDLAAYVEETWAASGWKEEGEWWHPSRYIDWERMARDLERSGDVWTALSPDGVFVFGN